MRAMTMDEVLYVSGGSIEGEWGGSGAVPYKVLGDIYPTMTGGSRGSGVYANATVIGPSGVGGSVTGGSNGQVNGGPAVGTPGASVTVGVTNNVGGIVNGPSATATAVGPGGVGGSVTGGAGTVGVGISFGTPGTSGSGSAHSNSPPVNAGPR